MSMHLQSELDKLKKKLLYLSSHVEQNLFHAIRSLEDRNEKAAIEVINADREVDLIEVDVEEDCLKILALYQPVAIDLRFVISALKINNDLERIGDLASIIAQRAKFLSRREGIPSPFDFLQMSEKTRSMLKKALDSLIHLDSQMAHDVCLEDDEVDSINRTVHIDIFERMKAEPEQTEPLFHYLSVSKHLERIADYATNIAEDVIYMVEGKIIRHGVDPTISLTKADS